MMFTCPPSAMGTAEHRNAANVAVKKPRAANGLGPIYADRRAASASAYSGVCCGRGTKTVRPKSALPGAI